MIIDAAMKVAKKKPLYSITRADIAEQAGVSESLVSYFLGDMAHVREKIVREAIERGQMKTVLEGFLAGVITKSQIPESLRVRIKEYFE